MCSTLTAILRKPLACCRTLFLAISRAAISSFVPSIRMRERFDDGEQSTTFAKGTPEIDVRSRLRRLENLNERYTAIGDRGPLLQRTGSAAGDDPPSYRALGSVDGEPEVRTHEQCYLC